LCPIHVRIKEYLCVPNCHILKFICTSKENGNNLGII